MSKSYKKHPGFQFANFKEPKKVANRKFRRTTKNDYNMPDGKFYRKYFNNKDMYESGYITYDQFYGNEDNLQKFFHGNEEECYLAYEQLFLRK